MFVRNLGKKDIKFTIGGKSIILKAQGVTSIDEGIISRKDLKNAYGHNIVILGEDTPVEQKPVELTKEEEQEVKDAIKDILLSLANVPVEEEKLEKVEEIKDKLTEDDGGTNKEEETQPEGTYIALDEIKEETDTETTGEEEKDEETETGDKEEKTEDKPEEVKEEKTEEVKEEAPAKQTKRRGGRKKKLQ